MIRNDDETQQMYITDSLAILSGLDGRLLTLGQAVSDIDPELLDSFFQPITTIRMGAAFTGFSAVKDMAHELERLLKELKTGALIPSPAVVETILGGFETIRTLLDTPELLTEERVMQQIVTLSELESKADQAPPHDRNTAHEPEQGHTTHQAQAFQEDKRRTMGSLEELLSDSDTGTKPQTSIRVGVNLLDTLMTLAGELVLSRNQLVQGVSAGNGQTLEAASQRIDMITSELQEAIMQTRMQPIGGLFTTFNRVIRDLARDLNKSIHLSIEGKEVELDKTILETIAAPLTHLVRSAVEHGIEPPEVRKMAGKSPEGQIRMRAFQEADQVNIEISDDGKGFDGDSLILAAVSKGLLTEKQADAMNDSEKRALIFLPGIATTSQATEHPVKEAGMDLVKATLDTLGGTIDVDSEHGRGTTFRIRLPLTLAIVPSQIITAGDERFAIPQVNLDELIRIPAAQVKERIEKVGNANVLRLRGNLLPVLSLARLLDIDRYYVDPSDGKRRLDRRTSIADRRSARRPSEQSEQSQSDTAQAESTHQGRAGGDRRVRAESALNIAVVSAGSFKYGLVVDRLQDSEEIVVKPLGRHLKGCEGCSGATIMGDGRVALILEVASLARMAGLNTQVDAADRTGHSVAAGKSKEDETNRTSLLLFRNLESEQFAVPLSFVERTERVPSSDIETVGGKRVLQYRGGSLPLYELSDAVSVAPLPDRAKREVIVFKTEKQEMGLLVSPPVDTVEVDLVLDTETIQQKGITGSIIVGGHITPIVDIQEFANT
ncbi:hypothetical protein DSLASN_06380 [Desulfoluna limicola]|uniref:histidine kinase n=1 Tax=Desulfoluna limicola TaxID=2810562 RepID=A0ABM7PBS8_9BACT|nr:chemotaxis protein CheA [Desulfoluna limicola]BCS95006.1 hypothetical protein DSLASN_06380 [Desulfoluna limicola]